MMYKMRGFFWIARGAAVAAFALSLWNAHVVSNSVVRWHGTVGYGDSEGVEVSWDDTTEQSWSSYAGRSSILLWWPIIVSGLACGAVWSNNLLGYGVLVSLFAAFCVIGGFSIGAAFHTPGWMLIGSWVALLIGRIMLDRQDRKGIV
ncbi:MAG TPA: hypothetical protein VGB99_13815, partial [Acidobacteriota bacterium]